MSETPILRVLKTDKSAVLPSKGHESDSGLDITIIKEYKRLGDSGVTLYDTGLKIAPTAGWYMDLVVRSSLMKYGYMLANNVGIIDQQYRGPLLVALYKFDKQASDIVLPMRVAQLIPRRVIPITILEVTEESGGLDETVRGSGGFGSTGHS